MISILYDVSLNDSLYVKTSVKENGKPQLLIQPNTHHQNHATGDLSKKS